MLIQIHILAIFGLGTWEIVLIVLILLLFFGGKKIPELLRGIRKGAKEFKDAANGSEEDNKANEIEGKDKV
ncbi:MAG: twin-arginine translocase TatA/TatE family subunit [Ignavibacteria bacterium]